MSAKQMVTIAQNFLRAVSALEAAPAWGRYVAIGNYDQEMRDALDEKGPWPEGAEPAPLTAAELAELEPLWSARSHAWAEWAEFLDRAIRGHLTVEERATAVREATRTGPIGAIFSELVGMFHAARRWT